MVMNADDESDYGCSDAFSLIASTESPEVGEMGYSLTVTSPSMGDIAMAGEEYTVEVSQSACVFASHEAGGFCPLVFCYIRVLNLLSYF